MQDALGGHILVPLQCWVTWVCVGGVRTQTGNWQINRAQKVRSSSRTSLALTLSISKYLTGIPSQSCGCKKKFISNQALQ